MSWMSLQLACINEIDADHIVDIGLGAGLYGGYIVAQGSCADIINSPESCTGQFLSGVRKISTHTKPHPINKKRLLRLICATGGL